MTITGLVRLLYRLAVFGAAVLLGHRAGHGLPGLALTLVAAPVAMVLHHVLHELGHLAVAKLTGLRVVRVRMFVAGRTSHVGVEPDPAGAALPARLIAFALGGPVVNLAGAGLAYWTAGRPMDALARAALLVAAAAGAGMGLLNFVPLTTHDGKASDGRNILRWLLHPGATRATLAEAQRRRADARTAVAIVRGAPVDAGAVLATAEDPLVLLAALVRQWQAAAPADRMEHTRRIAAAARDPRTPANTAALVATQLVNLVGPPLLADALLAGRPVRPADVAELGALADLAVRRRGAAEDRVALALVRLLEGRDAQVRDLTAPIRPGTGAEEKVAARAMLLRAIAEARLGDPAQGDRLAAAAKGSQPGLADLYTALRARGGRPETATTPVTWRRR